MAIFGHLSILKENIISEIGVVKTRKYMQETDAKALKNKLITNIKEEYVIPIFCSHKLKLQRQYVGCSTI